MELLKENISENELDDTVASQVAVEVATEKILQKILDNIDDIEDRKYELAFSKYILNMLKPQLDKLKQDINKSLEDDNQVIFETYFNSILHFYNPHKDICLYIDMEFDKYIPRDLAVKIANASQIALGMKAQVRISSLSNVAEIYMMFDDERFTTLFNKVKEKVIKEINELPNTKDLFVDDKYFEKAKEISIEIIDKLSGDTSL